MTYSRLNKTFNMTVTKMNKWHHTKHKTLVQDCIFCIGSMVEVAEFLKETYQLEIIDVGHAWIKIKAEKNYRKDHGGMTDESSLLYEIVSDKSNDPNNELTQGDNELLLKLQAKIKESTICPRCGSVLTLRKGQFGAFWGCTAFPNCKFTKNSLNMDGKVEGEL